MPVGASALAARGAALAAGGSVAAGRGEATPAAGGAAPAGERAAVAVGGAAVAAGGGAGMPEGGGRCGGWGLCTLAPGEAELVPRVVVATADSGRVGAWPAVEWPAERGGGPAVAGGERVGVGRGQNASRCAQLGSGPTGEAPRGGVCSVLLAVDYRIYIEI